MAQNIEIDKIIARMQSQGRFNPIKRFAYDITMEEGMKIVKAIGEHHNPNFVIDRENRFAYENIIKWVHGDIDAKAMNPSTHEIIPAKMKGGIYIAGSTGTGKTMCMEIIREYINAMNYRIVVNEEKRPLSYMICDADEITTAFMKNGDITRYKEAELLCIDDVGTEPTETMYMGNRFEVIRTLLERRGDRNDRLTFITSNYPFMHEGFRSRYGDRVVSRLCGAVNYYEIRGKDRRV
jgi:chromosomal replication initiation ATPase DnaA